MERNSPKPSDPCLDYTQRNIYNQINNFYDVLVINQDNNKKINGDFIPECISIDTHITQCSTHSIPFSSEEDYKKRLIDGFRVFKVLYQSMKNVTFQNFMLEQKIKDYTKCFEVNLFLLMGGPSRNP